MHVSFFMLFIFRDINHIENNSTRYYETSDHMLGVVSETNAAAPE